MSDRYRAADREIDGTGLQYVGGRFYDEETGRYLGEDPDGLAGTNLYRYSRNNPKNLIVLKGPKGDLFKGIVDGVSGFGNAFTFGLLNKLQDAAGVGDAVDRNSEAYKIGESVGRVAVVVIGGGGVTASLARLGTGLWGAAAIGAGVNTTLYVGMALANGEKVTVGGVLGAAFSGALGGLAGGLAAGRLFQSGRVFVGSVVAGVTGGTIAGAVNSLVQQYVDHGSVNGMEVLKSAGWGALGGGIGGAVFGSLGKAFGLLGRRAMSCNLGAGQVARYAALNALTGAAGGFVAEAAIQLLQTGGLDKGKLLSAAAAGAIGGSAGYLAMRALYRACFLPETPTYLNRHESKPIIEFKSYEEYGEDCDSIITRDESNPNAPLEMRRVLRKFIRIAPVLNVHVGGRIIGTTAEHPFHVEGKGWRPAAELKAGDVLLDFDGPNKRVEKIVVTGEVKTVVNLEVEGCHTYFVGSPEWGFAVWAHNAYDGRRGNQDTRDDIDVQRDAILKQHTDWKHKYGGTDAATGAPKPELFVPGSGGGKKGSTYPDLSFLKPDGTYHHHNTVDTYADGITLTKREAANLARLEELRSQDTVTKSPKPK